MGWKVSWHENGKERKKERKKKERKMWSGVNNDSRKKIYGRLRPTNLTNGDNRGTLTHDRLKRETIPRLISETWPILWKAHIKVPTVFVPVCRCVWFTWSLEVDSAQLHGISGMVRRHSFAAGETALSALSLSPFPGIADQHTAFYCTEQKLNLGKCGIC